MRDRVVLCSSVQCYRLLEVERVGNGSEKGPGVTAA